MSETGKLVRSPEKISWCRLWHEMTEDPKLRLVAHKSGCSMAEVIGVFAAMMTNASAAENRGTLEGWDQEAMAYSLGIPEDRLDAIYSAMQGKVLDGDRLRGWERRQPKREREYAEPSTERVREHRARKAAQSETGAHDGDARPVLHGVATDVTPCNTMKRLETCREEESRYISTPLDYNYNPRDSDEDTGGGGVEFVEFSAESKSERVAAPTLAPIAATASHPVEEIGTLEGLTEPSATRRALVLPAAPPAPPPAADPSPWDDDPCDPRGPRLKAPPDLHRWDWVAVQARLKGSPRVDAAFLARTLAEADRDPFRRHWRSELDQLICDAQPDSVTGFAAYRVRRWLAGDAPAPPPAAPRYADLNSNPEYREFLKNYPHPPQRTEALQ